jgi:ABC-type transporter Mla subunit MlaD
MTPEEILQKSDTLQQLIAGHMPDTNQPISQAEAAAIRDRLRSLINLITRAEEHYSQLDSKVQELRARAEDAEEVAKQFKHLAIKVQELVANVKDLTTRVQAVESKLGLEAPVPTPVEEPPPSRKPRKKKQ